MNNTFKKLATYVILALGVVLMIVGLARSENMQIFSKAVNVCLECIGIG